MKLVLVVFVAKYLYLGTSSSNDCCVGQFGIHPGKRGSRNVLNSSNCLEDLLFVKHHLS